MSNEHLKRKCTLITTDGIKDAPAPKRNTDYSLEELQGFVGGLIEIIDLSDGMILVVNEEGAINNMPINMAATKVCCMFGHGEVVFGDVLLCPTEMVL